MTEKTFRALLEDAESAIETYKHPNIDKARERLNAVLIAAGLGSTSNDEITDLRLGHKKLIVTTRYSIRCCEQSDRFELPVTIIDAPDPVQAARLWGLSKKRDEAAGRVRWDEQTLQGSRARLAELDQQLADLGIEVED